MKVKQKFVTVLVLMLSIVSIGMVAQPALALSCGTMTGPDGKEVPVSTSIIGGDACSGATNKSGSAQDNGIWKLLILVLNIMTAGVGILAVAGIVYGSILYTTASDKAEQTKKAIGIITNVVIGIIAYGLMYLGLNFLIPGGIFT